MTRARSYTAVALLALLVACGNESPPAADAVASEPQVPSSTSAPLCEHGTWPPVVRGLPTEIRETPPTGYYVWHGYLGWSVRAVNSDPEPRTFTGSVVASGPSISAKPFPEDGDVRVAVTGNRLEFEIPAGPEPQGFDLVVGCESKLVRLELNGPDGPWPIESIFLGDDGSAYDNPLVIERKQ